MRTISTNALALRRWEFAINKKRAHKCLFYLKIKLFYRKYETVQEKEVAQPDITKPKPQPLYVLQ